MTDVRRHQTQSALVRFYEGTATGELTSILKRKLLSRPEVLGLARQFGTALQLGGPLESELIPDIVERRDELSELDLRVEGRGRDTEALAADGHGREVCEGRMVDELWIRRGRKGGRTDALDVELVLV
jgi:hypothetical protein